MGGSTLGISWSHILDSFPLSRIRLAEFVSQVGIAVFFSLMGFWHSARKVKEF